jgi:hypothetical protein
VGKGPRSFDPEQVGNRETDAWIAYYRRDWIRFLVASVGMVAAGFGMNPLNTLRGAWLVLRANQVWAPFPDNDPELARTYMRRFYTLVELPMEPAEAARREVEWWRVHRERQHDPAIEESHLIDALIDLYSYIFQADRQDVRPAAVYRVEAMGWSDRWVAEGCRLDDPSLTKERQALVASYLALHGAVRD